MKIEGREGGRGETKRIYIFKLTCARRTSNPRPCKRLLPQKLPTMKTTEQAALRPALTMVVKVVLAVWWGGWVGGEREEGKKVSELCQRQGLEEENTKIKGYGWGYGPVCPPPLLPLIVIIIALTHKNGPRPVHTYLVTQITHTHHKNHTLKTHKHTQKALPSCSALMPRSSPPPAYLSARCAQSWSPGNRQTASQSRHP